MAVYKTQITRAIDPRRLQLGKRIARGGLAEIFEATDHNGQFVIVRRFRHDLRFDLRLRRIFMHGIFVRRKLSVHPHIVQYYGEGGFLEPYEVIEYVPGDSLKELIVRKHRAVHAHPLRILRQAAEALAHVHNRGFLHMDLKPENYLVRLWDDTLELKLTDFDLCVPIGTRQAPPKYGGSPMYCPPEYFTRKSVCIGTDIFAFGVMAYNLFTFQLPFMTSAITMIQKHGKYEIKYPEGHGSLAYPSVRKFLDRCLAQFPEERFRSDEALLKGLDELESELYQDELRAGHQPSETVPPGEAPPPDSGLRRPTPPPDSGLRRPTPPKP